MPAPADVRSSPAAAAAPAPPAVELPPPRTPHEALQALKSQRQARRAAIEAHARELQEQAKHQRSRELLRGRPARVAFAELADAALRSHTEIAASDTCVPPLPPPASSSSSAKIERPKRPAGERAPLTRNPRKLAYYRDQCRHAARALAASNRHARSEELDRLTVPRQVHDLAHAISDGSDALAGALDWIRRHHGPAVALEVEAACLLRERGGVQRDDWSRPRARRKCALLTFLLMAPHALARSLVTGSPSDEVVLVTAGVPQTLLVLLTRSAQREPYSTRTLQRDLAEIDRCTDLLLRWRTPVAHAQTWERGNSEHGVVNRYCVRAGMVADQWRRARDGAEAMIKGTAIRLASWLVWRPAPSRGSPVAWEPGGWLTTAARPAPA